MNCSHKTGERNQVHEEQVKLDRGGMVSNSYATVSSVWSCGCPHEEQDHQDGLTACVVKGLGCGRDGATLHAGPII